MLLQQRALLHRRSAEGLSLLIPYQSSQVSALDITSGGLKDETKHGFRGSCANVFEATVVSTSTHPAARPTKLRLLRDTELL